MNKMTTDRRALYKRIATLTLPIVLQNLLSAAVSSADVIMLNFVGQSHISAVSLASQYAMVLFSVFYGLGTGVTMMSAQYYGKGDMRTIQGIQGIALRYSVTISVLFASAALIIPEAMMRAFTPSPELIAIGAQYLRYASVAYLCWGVIEVHLATLRATGRVAICTALNMTAFGLNILLNAVFIFGLFGAPKMGAAGVALATSLSRLVELVLVCLVSARSRDVKLRLRDMFGINRVLRKDFIRMALPALANDVVWGLAFSLYSLIIGQFLGADMVAANAFATQVRNFATTFCFGLASGGGILMGHIIGENRLDDAEYTAKELMKLTWLSGLAGGLVVLGATPFVLRFADLTATGKGYLKIMLLINSYYVFGPALNTMMICGIFRSGGDSRWGFICDVIDMWCYALPMGFIAAAVLKLPPMWVYFLLCTDEFVKWPWVFRHYHSKKWLRNITRDDLYEKT